MRRASRALLICLAGLTVVANGAATAKAEPAGRAPAGSRPPVARPATPGDAAREQPVSLIADAVEYDSENGIVTASGNVEIFYGERTLTARRIVYDSRTGRVSAEGDIILRDGSGATVFADTADLDTELRDGLVRGARSVMGDNVRLSAVEARRIDDRYNALSKAVYSPCRVCAEDPTPLWRIRARRVIHDEADRRIHYQDATFDIMGVPVAWLPVFSHPDPEQDRASGFLVPEFRHSKNIYGYGALIPYYWVIDDHSDLTVTPFISTKESPLGMLEYRRALSSGRFDIGGSGTFSDYEGSNAFHGHIQAEGLFDLPNDVKWGFDGMASTDNGYLRRFDISDEDRLTSELFLRRYRSDGYFDLSTVYFQSLRDDEPAGQIPFVLPDFDARQDLDSPVLGGTLGFFSSSAVLLRGEGLDTGRLSFGADWEREEILPSGLLLRAFASARGDAYLFDDFDGVGDATEVRLAPVAGIEARYPLINDAGGTVSHVIEPVAQAVFSPYGVNNDVPNEDSQVTEFDEKNLFDISRFSGVDRFEEGPRINLGMRYELIAQGGLNFDASVGQVFRFRDADEFSDGSGLSGKTSDWVGSWAASYDPYVTVRQRMRIGDGFSITRNELAGELHLGRLDLETGYVFLEADPAVSAPDDREELASRAAFRLDRNWSVSGRFRRDLQLDEFVEYGGGLTFANECCRIDLFVRRTFTESDDNPSGTSVGVQVRLFTLGSQEAATD